MRCPLAPALKCFDKHLGFVRRFLDLLDIFFFSRVFVHAKLKIESRVCVCFDHSSVWCHLLLALFVLLRVINLDKKFAVYAYVRLWARKEHAVTYSNIVIPWCDVTRQNVCFPVRCPI